MSPSRNGGKSLAFRQIMKHYSDDFVRYRATTCDEVPTSPEMSSPELLRQSPVFAQQFAGGFPLSRCMNMETEIYGGKDGRRCRWSLACGL